MNAIVYNKRELCQKVSFYCKCEVKTHGILLLGSGHYSVAQSG